MPLAIGTPNPPEKHAPKHVSADRKSTVRMYGGVAAVGGKAQNSGNQLPTGSPAGIENSNMR